MAEDSEDQFGDDAEAIVRALHERIDAWWHPTTNRKEGSAGTDILVQRLAAALGKDAAGLAQELGLDKQTVTRWMDGQSVPRSNAKAGFSRLIASAKQPGRLLASFTSDEFAVLERQAQEVWVFKWNRRFLTADEDALLKTMVEFMRAKNHGLPKFYYVFAYDDAADDIEGLEKCEDSPDKGERPFERWEAAARKSADLIAHESFDVFRDTVMRKYGVTEEQFGQVITEFQIVGVKELLQFGLPRFDLGLVLIEYPEGVRDGAVEVYMESEWLLSDGSVETLWLPRPPAASREFRKRWRSLMDRARAERKNRSSTGQKTAA